ncbi:hypothetical protein [Shewanella halifaxensis]|uniref:hypothetical protein n=1 Tax=Shewanella halifaxensis TaxID=271098 RepID=UPI001CBFAD8E|nr:hypothetical protein [Shewanella halifaxensis]
MLILSVCFVTNAQATSISSDIELIFPPKGIEIGQEDDSEPLYKSVGLDVKMQDGEAVYTLNASFDIGETWRVFGEYDNNEFWEAGVGKSFYNAFMFTEVTAKANRGGYSAGVFAGIPVSETVILMADTNYNWSTLSYDFQYDGKSIQVDGSYSPSDTIDFMLGFSWRALERLNVSYSYNHVYETTGDRVQREIHIPDFEYDDKRISRLSKGNYNYHEITLTTEVWKLSPYFTYTYFPNSENFYEFGLSFKW